MKENVIVDIPVFIINNDNNDKIVLSALKTKLGFEITVYIEDVAARINTGTPLDNEMKHRQFACNFLNNVAEIVPKEAIQKIGLVEGKKKACVAFKLCFDANGQRTDYDVFEAIVEPCKTIEAKELLYYLEYRDEIFENEYYSIIDEIFTLMECYNALPKVTTLFLKTQEKDVQDRTIDRLFDLLYTECEIITSEIFLLNHFPAIYSFYPLPSLFNIERLIGQCKEVDVDASILMKNKISCFHVKDMLNNIEKSNVKKAILIHLNQICPPKQYISQPAYNFKTGSCTCPIANPLRNYAALYNQRLLKRYIKKTLFNDNVENVTYNTIKDICTDLTKQEINKVNAEKEFTHCMYAEQLMSETTVEKGLVYSITPSGVYVMLKNGITGLVKFEDYQISDKKMTFIHNNIEDTIFIGDKINVVFNYYDVKNTRFIFEYIP